MHLTADRFAERARPVRWMRGCTSCLDASDVPGRDPRVDRAGEASQADELPFDSLGNGATVGAAEAPQDQTIDAYDDASHIHPLVSPPVTGRSRFDPSSVAAWNRCTMPTGSPDSAAKNAAFSAMFRMLPPDTMS